MKRLLLTGASGLLGLNLALQAGDRYRITGVANDNAVRNTPFALQVADLTAPGVAENILRQAQPEILIHCAALANIDACEAQPELARRVNAELPGELAALCARLGIRMVHISTDAVFDGERGNYTEEDSPNPLSVYARTKLEGEQAVLQTYPQALVARVNFYGWSLSGTRSLAEFFFNHLKAGKRINGFTDVYFCTLLVNHLAEILLRLAEGGWSGLMHVVSGEALSKYEFGVRLARQFGLEPDLIQPVSVQQGGLAAARSPNLTLRNDKLLAAVGAPPSQAEGLRTFYEYYLQGYPARLQALRA